MKRALVVAAALAVAGFAFVSCNSQQPSALASVVGARDLVRVDSLLFVTSSERNELRAIVLRPELNYGRDFVRGPNPLEALSIPVLNRPTILVADTHWGSFTYPTDGGIKPGETIDGFELYGPYLYAASPGAAEISVVNGKGRYADAGPGTLQETVRLPTAAPVSSLAAYGDVDRGVSTLYFATFDGSQAVLQRVALAQPGYGDITNAGELTAAVEILQVLPSTVINDMVVLPNERLAFSERSSLGQSGDVVVLDTRTRARTVMKFPSPVRQLATHGAANVFYCQNGVCPEDADAGVYKAIAPGGRLFGVLDEEFCGSSACAGILAVDTTTGEIEPDIAGLQLPDCPSPTGGPCARDATDRQMLPVKFDSLPTSLALAPGGNLKFFNGIDWNTLLEVSTLGVTPVAGSGNVYFWNAGTLQQYDINTNGPGATFDRFYNSVDAGFEMPPNLSFPGTVVDGGVVYSLYLGDGRVNDEGLVVVANGRIPGLTDLPLTSTEVSTPYAARAAAGDIVEISGCGDGQVVAVGADTLTLSVPAGCTAATGTVLTAGDTPYLVVGELSGFIGRAGKGRETRFPGPVRYRPVNFDPVGSMLGLTFLDGETAPRGSFWRFVLEDNYRNYTAYLDPFTTCNASLPAASLFDLERQRAYITYPSSVQEFDTRVTVTSTTYSNFGLPGRCFQ